ncbi:hypothetical protein C6366_17940 [Desulfonatronum sp. SC1]|nr:hypothetical protein C6366_17940 [Desulfonatronum sp. SC1]
MNRIPAFVQERPASIEVEIEVGIEVGIEIGRQRIHPGLEGCLFKIDFDHDFDFDISPIEIVS